MGRAGRVIKITNPAVHNFAGRIDRTSAEFESLFSEVTKAEGIRLALQTCHAGCQMP